ncbi:MAG: thioredoxin domain-containing protein [Chloroflexota bacterium]
MDARLQNLIGVTILVCTIAGTVAFVRTQVARRDGRAASMAVRHVSNATALQRDVPHEGASVGAVALVAFMDYQCAGCRAMQVVIDSLLQRNATSVAVFYRHYPLTTLHESAYDAARAAVCAAEGGHFGAFHRLAFKEQDLIATKAWTTLAVRAGVSDTTRFRTCLATTRPDTVVQRDAAAGDALGLVGTPSFIVGDSLYTGYRSTNDLQDLISNAGRRSRSAP